MPKEKSEKVLNDCHSWRHILTGSVTQPESPSSGTGGCLPEGKAEIKNAWSLGALLPHPRSWLYGNM